jgi:uncharacterized protein
VHVGICRFTLLVTGSHSLKEKRSVLRRLKDRVRDRGVTLSEVGGQDTWQRADLAFAVVAGERDRAQAALDGVLRQAAGVDGAQIAAARTEVLALGDDWYASAAALNRSWDDKVGTGDDDQSWVPGEWLADEEGKS